MEPPRLLDPPHLERSALDVDAAYREHRAELYNYLRRCGTPRDAAEDLTHGAFLVLLEHQERYDAGRGPLRLYLFGIARNLRHAWRRRGRREAPELQVERSGTAGGAAGRLLLEEALMRLPEALREALVLRELHGLTYEEIAHVQRIPLGTVRSRLSAARKGLREGR